MVDAFLVNLSEIRFAGSKDAVGKFKALITDTTTLNINQKGVQKNNIVTTKNDNPLSIKKGDRRFSMIRSRDDEIGNNRYFNKLYALLDDTDTNRTIYSYFRNYIRLRAYEEDTANKPPDRIRGYSNITKISKLMPKGFEYYSLTGY